ncbi:RimK family alpha-L-glutamate ligase [Gracilibacillus kekensis]|uniref:SSU ribosomal protein S6P modification protein n=1 Tax=Gracilibacillus kekensis TaxID=1027249 RepID=A0A1M7QBC9_9BACI|nr:RimK family alpha-L-glutamate ligase [Gracilibacillus kekensis]SHN27797.1 SSU ribosomal protein S6P modification protein [Gracilibacillus kekensis]
MSKKGWIIYNGNLHSTKFSEQVEWLMKTARSFNLEMKAIKNNDLLVTVHNGQAALSGISEYPDFVFFWDKDLFLARQLEKMGIRLFNRARAIEICDDKALTYQYLSNHGITMPQTIIAPKVFMELHDTSHLSIVKETIGFPLIIKETFGSFGEQVYLINKEEDLIKKTIELGNKPYIFQKYIHSSYGKDVRLNVVGDQVVASMLRKSDNDFRANVTAGGRMNPYQPSEQEQELAIRCSQLIGTDFAGVDLLFGENGEPILCEVNSNSHFKNIYDCTSVDITINMFEYIKDVLESRR